MPVLYTKMHSFFVCVKMASRKRILYLCFVQDMRLITYVITTCVFTLQLFATNKDSLLKLDHSLIETIEVERDASPVYSSDLVSFSSNMVPTNAQLFNYHVNSLEFVIPMDYNQRVKDQIDYFGTSWQYRLKEVITLSEHYFPIYEEILDKHELPLELKYLSVIESALNPYAKSWVGAVGPWQFMPATGRLFDLDVNYVVDERRSVEKSTEAAAKYLKSMYEMFGDWHVALASYNCGPGNVRKAIRRSGRTDFWGMYHFLPRETRNYVPKFIAMAYMMNFYHEFGILPAPPTHGFDHYHPVHCKQRMSFQVVSEMLGMSKEELLSYNPELKEAVIPHSSSGYWLNIPHDKVSLFYEWEEDLVVCSQEEDRAEKEWRDAQPKYVYHSVRRGESLGVIARRYHCSVSQLKQWNNLRSNTIHPNQKLKILRT